MAQKKVTDIKEVDKTKQLDSALGQIERQFGLVSGVYDERGSYQKVVNVEIQSDFESIQNVFVVIDHNYN